MPELPDITIYIEALQARIVGHQLARSRVASPFLLRSVTPPLHAVEGKTVRELRRIGKRIAIGLDENYWLVVHLMIAGRFHWREPGAKLAARSGLAAFDFPHGTLVLTEAGWKKRASLHIVQIVQIVQEFDPGGLEVLDSGLSAFATRLTLKNHTLKRALTDPHLFSGIGNAYSDEILHRVRLSPVALTQRLGEKQIEELYTATRETLLEWTEKLRQEAGGNFPEHVTAFREGMAVHGRFGLPCRVAAPRCSVSVTPTMRPTTAPVARRAASCSPTAASRAS
jgi:formamidopyrimidine-DNA glycosylase